MLMSDMVGKCYIFFYNCTLWVNSRVVKGLINVVCEYNESKGNTNDVRGC